MRLEPAHILVVLVDILHDRVAVPGGTRSFAQGQVHSPAAGSMRNHFAADAPPSVVQHSLEVVAGRLALVVSFEVGWAHKPIVAPVQRHAHGQVAQSVDDHGAAGSGPDSECQFEPGAL